MNYKYGFSHDSTRAAPLPGGIHHEVALYQVSFEALSPNNPTMVLRFYFAKDEMYFKYTELPVDTVAMTSWNFKKTTYEEMVARKFKEQGERLKHIFTAITGQHKVELQANTWDSFCKQYISLIAERYKGMLYSIKIVYNDRGYTTFPDRSINPFIVPDKHQSLLKIDPRFDRIQLPMQTKQGFDSDEAQQHVHAAYDDEEPF